MLTASLDIEGHEVQTEAVPRLLEQVVGHLARHGVVRGLGHLVDQPHGVVVEPARLEQVVWLLQHLGQLLCAEELVVVGPPLHRARQQRVPEPVGAGGEALDQSEVRIVVSTNHSSPGPRPGRCWRRSRRSIRRCRARGRGRTAPACPAPWAGTR